MDHEEAEGKQDVQFWVEYYAKFGMEHQLSVAHNLPSWKRHDLDIKGMIGIVLISFVLGIWMLLEKLFCASNKAK